MKILVISNIFPPPPIGGYEQLCQDVVGDLERRGHDVYVLTSSYERVEATVEGKVYRWLALDRHFYSYKTKGAFLSACINRKFFNKAVSIIKPDLLYVWNMENLDRLLLNTIEQSNIPAVYHLSAPWILWPDRITDIFNHAEHVPVIKYLARLIRPYLDRKQLTYNCRNVSIGRASFSCSSLQKEVKDAGIAIQEGKVILEGIPLELFPGRDFDSYAPEKLKTFSLLYAGQLVRHKGVHTAILAVAKLVNVHNVRNFHLTVIGPGEPDYCSHLKALVEQHKITDYVSFCAPVPRIELGSMLPNFHILVFPSIWEEPWSLMLLQGMACGLAVVGTATGGSKELLVHAENSLIFPPDNEADLADRIRTLLKSPELMKKIGFNAQKHVRANFGIESMVDQVEKQLVAALNQRLHYRSKH